MSFGVGLGFALETGFRCGLGLCFVSFAESAIDFTPGFILLERGRRRGRKKGTRLVPLSSAPGRAERTGDAHRPSQGEPHHGAGFENVRANGKEEEHRVEG